MEYIENREHILIDKLREMSGNEDKPVCTKSPTESLQNVKHFLLEQSGYFQPFLSLGK